MKTHELKQVNVKGLLKKMNGESPNDAMYQHFYKRKFLLHWGGLADPFCSFEKTNGTGLELIKGLGKLNYPTLFSFKGPTILEKNYLKCFEKYQKQSNFAFQASIITRDDDMAKRVEIGVPSPTKRLKALKELSDMGYWTILRLRPFIMGISDVGLEELLNDALAAGINGISCEFFAMDARANIGMKTRYDWLGQLTGIKDMHDYYTVLSPKERGGYRRLNRLVKEPYIKKIYKFCIENNLVCGISDPDFKELNTSGSCCAMPDNFKKNPEMQNWTTSQLTYHLKEIRKTYHKTGKLERLYFDKVYNSDKETYLEEWRFANDHPCTVGMSQARVRSTNLKQITQRSWNNLRSPGNPRNYFHGKVIPVDQDSTGNLVFEYAPHEYETQWKKEGIDLTK